MYASNRPTGNCSVFRPALAAVLLVCLIGPLEQAAADPIVLRGGQDDTVLKGQATMTAPQAAPGFQSALPPTAAGAGANVQNVQNMQNIQNGAAHWAEHPNVPYQAQSARQEARPVTAVKTPERRTYFQEHPKVRAALLGAGVGTAAGAVAGLVTHRGVLRGAAIGAGAGAGVGLIRSSDTLKHHPIMKDLATGAVAGLGLGLASSHHLGGRAAKLTAVGAALGLGVGVLKDKLK